jgi:hypothetical protein
MKKTFVFFILGFLLVGCEGKVTQATLFDNPICNLPCWHNITPGVTAKGEAIAILDRFNSADKAVVDNNQSGNGFDDWISFTGTGNQNNYSGWLYILDNRVLMLNFKFNAGYPGVRLDHSIELFGKPQSILVVHTGNYDQVTLLEPTKGIATGYKLYGSQGLEASSIAPETEITEIAFFDANQYQHILDAGLIAAGTLSGKDITNNLLPWLGYGRFKDKYWPPASP